MRQPIWPFMAFLAFIACKPMLQQGAEAKEADSVQIQPDQEHADTDSSWERKPSQATISKSKEWILDPKTIQFQ